MIDPKGYSGVTIEWNEVTGTYRGWVHDDSGKELLATYPVETQRECEERLVRGYDILKREPIIQEYEKFVKARRWWCFWSV